MTFFEEAEPEMEQTHPPKFSSAKPEAPPGREKDAGPRRAPIGSQSVKAGRREGRPCRKKETAQKKNEGPEDSSAHASLYAKSTFETAPSGKQAVPTNPSRTAGATNKTENLISNRRPARI